jgi:hypothetical protein
MTSVQIWYHAAMTNQTICYQQLRLTLVSSHESWVGKNAISRVTWEHTFALQPLD